MSNREFSFVSSVSIERGAIYGFADSSPQVGHEWLVGKIRFISTSDLPSVFEAMSTLALDGAAVPVTDIDDIVGCDEEQSRGVANVAGYLRSAGRRA